MVGHFHVFWPLEQPLEWRRPTLPRSKHVAILGSKKLFLVLIAPTRKPVDPAASAATAAAGSKGTGKGRHGEGGRGIAKKGRRDADNAQR